MATNRSGPMEKAIRESAPTLTSSKIALTIIDSWPREKKAAFLNAHRRSDYAAMDQMLPRGLGDRSIRFVNNLRDILATVFEEQLAQEG